MENILNRLNKQSIELLNPKREILEPDIFKYISISTTSILHVYISVIFSNEIQTSEIFNWGPKYKDILLRIKNNNLKKGIKYLSMDLFAYAEEQFSIEDLNNDFLDYNRFKNEYLEQFNFNNLEKRKFKENLNKFKTGYNSKLILDTMNFPKKDDDDYLLNILDMIKEEHLPRMYISAKKLQSQISK